MTSTAMRQAPPPYPIEFSNGDREYIEVADVQEELERQFGSKMDEDGNPFTENLMYETAVELATRRRNDRRWESPRKGLWLY